MLTPSGNDIVKYAFLFACFTGCGEAEVQELTWENVKKNNFFYKRKKSGTVVELPLNPTIETQILSKLDKNSDILFPLKSVQSTRKILKSWVKKAEIEKDISFYCARHTFAISLLKAGSRCKRKTKDKSGRCYQHKIN